jgi:8-amino-3,8-dideoxy-alpha-D-manno-octulosonate transaminase
MSVSVGATNAAGLPARLAIDGGEPARTRPLPWELPGAHWIGEEEAELVGRVVRAQSPFRFYGLDPQHMAATLEREWRQKFGAPHVLAMASGTAALGVALGAIGVGPGDEVLVPGYMWTSCLSAIVRQGAIPRLVDIDDTFCLCPRDLERKINARSRAVLFVNMSGAQGRVAEVARIAHAHGLKVVEDCAQAAGAHVRGRWAGSDGDIAIFSFQLNKNMTSGDGGMLTTADPVLFRRAYALHDLGYPRNAEGRLDASDPDCQLWGVGARMSDLAAAMALAQFRKLDRITGAMRQAKWAIRRQIEGIPGLGFRTILDPEGDSGPFLITTYPDAETCRRFTAALRAEGIKGPEGSLACITMEEWGLHWYFNVPSLVHKRPAAGGGYPWTHPANAFHEQISYSRGALPVCDEMEQRAALLAIASVLTPADVDDIVAAFRKVAATVLR